jgi:hypothetical protein
MTYFPQEPSPSVSSALKRFTSVFGKGTGGTTSLKSPGGNFTMLMCCLVVNLSRPKSEKAQSVELN